LEKGDTDDEEDPAASYCQAGRKPDECDLRMASEWAAPLIDGRGRAHQRPATLDSAEATLVASALSFAPHGLARSPGWARTALG
jgi:hypothetical protein